MDPKKANKPLLFLAALVSLSLIVFLAVFFSFRARHKAEELKGAAQKLFDRPVKLIMGSPEGASKKRAHFIPPEQKRDEILVDDFDTGLTSGLAPERKNCVGGYHGTFSMRPSYAVIAKSSEIRRGDEGRGLVIDYKKEAGWCGWYTLLNNIDVTPFNTLSFWVKGQNGGEKFDIGLADARMQELGIDAMIVGCVNSFIPGGTIAKEWKEVKVPRKGFLRDRPV